MLYEVVCDEFNQKRIEFHNGLNTVLGDDEGSNSIGKSTFLLIIDFVFGGDDYLLKSLDVHKFIGFHTIKFAFVFENIKYYFSRNTKDTEIVSECDSEYKITNEISIDKFTSFLAVKYELDLTYITFRNIVGRYIRVYGKENIDEKRPLNIIPNEKAGAPINALLKLFGKYKVLDDLQRVADVKSENIKVYRKAQQFSFISKINKTQLKKNQKEIIELNDKKNALTEKLNGQLLDLDSQLSEHALKLKNELSVLKRHRSRLISQLNALESVTRKKYSDNREMLAKLETYFPGTNLKLLNDIEQFHSEITSVLSDELKQKRNEIQDLIKMTDKEIENVESQFKEIISNPNLPKIVLTEYTEIVKKIDKLTQENESFEKERQLKEAYDLVVERLYSTKLIQVNQLQIELNTKMSDINGIIYAGIKKAPALSINNNQYIFSTEDDTGTGTSYKGLVVYDLSVLELTQLPILVHDSVVLKQIADVAIQEILKLYEKSGKQVIVSLDKINSYSKVSADILNKNAVLRLAPGGNELFGRSWSNINNNR